MSFNINVVFFLFILHRSSSRSFISPPPLSVLQTPEVTVSPESGIPRDASGGIDYVALVQLLKDTQSLQDQADILYILFKDK